MQETQVMQLYLPPLQVRLINMLYNNPCERAELVRRLKTARTTIYQNLEKLEDRKLVKRYKAPGLPTRGRPKIIWNLTPSGINYKNHHS